MTLRENTIPFEKTKIAKAIELQVGSVDVRKNINNTVISVGDLLSGKTTLDKGTIGGLAAMDKLSEEASRREKEKLLEAQFVIRAMAAIAA